MESWERMLEDIREAIDLKDATIAERNATIKEQAEKMECEVARRDHLIKELFDKVDEREESLKKAKDKLQRAMELLALIHGCALPCGNGEHCRICTERFDKLNKDVYDKDRKTHKGKKQ